jgi:hypothetical protein
MPFSHVLPCLCNLAKPFGKDAKRLRKVGKKSRKIAERFNSCSPALAPVYGAVTYNWQLVTTNAPTVILQTIETTAASVSFGGLTPGLIYQVIVNAVGTAGTSDWSQPTNQMVA